ncbi:gamma carbonic anhydrase family protein [Gordonia sp. NPDC003424]
MSEPSVDNAVPQALVRALPGAEPDIDASAWIAPTAVVVGGVDLGPDVSVWYGAVLRAEMERITIGAGCNLQDGVVAHVDPGSPLRLGRNISVGHNAVLHGCTVEDDCLVGMGSVIMNGAVIGAGSLVAAGALVTEGTEVPPKSLVAGVPAKVRRELTDEESERIGHNAAVYRELLAVHRDAV